MWRVAVKGLLAHKLRLALTALAIVLGVTFVSGTLVLTDTLHNTFTSLFDKIYQHIDFEVRGKAAFTSQSGGSATRKPIPDSLLPKVRSVPGVQVADGGVGGYAQFVAKNGKAITTGGAPTIGLTYSADRQLSSLVLVSGTGPTTSHQVVMDEGTAKKYGFKVGNSVAIILPGPTQRFDISGIVRFGTADNLAGATIAAFNLPTAQKLFNMEGQLDSIDVIASPGANKAQVQERIAKVLPTGVEVVTGQTVADEQSSSINQALGFFSTALLVFAFISLFVGAFTIFNTFSITIGQRTRELALLRIVGASRRQIFWSVLLEAFLVGLLASLVGLALGVAAAEGLTALLNGFGVTLPQGPLVFEARTVVASLAIGIGVTVISAISPARRAVRIPPIAALTSQQGSTEESSRRRVAVGSVVGILGIVLLALGLSLPAIQLVGLGAVAIFVGVGMLAPLVARPMSSVIGRPLARGVSGRLGRQNSMRSPRRTAQTASALMVGLALVSTISVFGASVSKSATQSISDAIAADYIVTASTTGGPPGGFSAASATTAAGIPGVSYVSSVYSGQFELKGAVKTLAGFSPANLSKTLILRMNEGNGPAALADGSLLIDSNTATKEHLKVGQRVPAVFAETGPTTMVIGGIYKPNAVLGSFLVGEDYFKAHNNADKLPIALLLSTAKGASSTQTAALTKGLASFPNLKIQTRAEFEKTQEAQINQVLALVYVLLALAIVIALIGIVNTLMLSVFERTHEIGLLRAVGMRRRQVRAMIRSEAVILAIFGAVIGIVVGTGLGVALASSLKDQGITDIVIPWASLVVFLVLAGLLGLGAASWPARRAAKLNVLDAIATD